MILPLKGFGYACLRDNAHQLAELENPAPEGGGDADGDGGGEFPVFGGGAVDSASQCGTSVLAVRASLLTGATFLLFHSSGNLYYAHPSL